MKNKLELFAAAALIAACGGVANADDWVGGGDDNEYSTTNNWNTGVFAGTTQNISGDFVVDRSVDSVAQRTFVAGGATLNVTGGVHNDNRSGASIYNFVGSGSAGTVNQSGGTFSIGHSLRIGSNNVNSDGIFTLSGGLLSVYRGSNSAIDSTNPGGRPSMEVGNLQGSGLFEISGGAMETRGGVHIGDTGIFSVVGSGATSIGIGSNQSADGIWLQTSNSTLRASIDLGGVTTIFIDDVDGDNGVFAEFREGSLLDLSFNGIAPTPGTWTLMEVEGTGITDLGLGLSGTTGSGWSFGVDNSGVNGLLTATYIPEPSTFVLLALGAVGLLVRRMRVG